MITILEHRVPTKLAPSIVHTIARDWKVEFNHIHNDRGRVWVLWNSKFGEFKTLEIHDQLIHGLMNDYGAIH